MRHSGRCVTKGSSLYCTNYERFNSKQVSWIPNSKKDIGLLQGDRKIKVAENGSAIVPDERVLLCYSK